MFTGFAAVAHGVVHLIFFARSLYLALQSEWEPGVWILLDGGLAVIQVIAYFLLVAAGIGVLTGGDQAKEKAGLASTVLLAILALKVGVLLLAALHASAMLGSARLLTSVVVGVSLVALREALVPLLVLWWCRSR